MEFEAAEGCVYFISDSCHLGLPVQNGCNKDSKIFDRFNVEKGYRAASRSVEVSNGCRFM